MKFSIIIPVKALNDYLKESLPKINGLSYKNFDIWILPNAYQDVKTGTVASQEVIDHDPWFHDIKACSGLSRKIHIVPTGRKSPAVKRDLGAKLCNGDVLAFLDDDAYPQPRWLERAVAAFHSDANPDAVGGPGVTPMSDTPLQKGSGLVFETVLGGGGLRYRYHPLGKPRRVDDFPSVNLLVKREAFLKTGGFDCGFWPGEDTVFCRNFIKNYTIWYFPDVIVYHHRRTLFYEHLKQIRQYALHRGFFVKRFPENSRKLVYFLPSVFVWSLMTGWVTFFVPAPFYMIYSAVVIGYFFFNFFNALWVAKDFKTGVLTFFGVVLTHIFYGLWFTLGLLKKDIKSRLR